MSYFVIAFKTSQQPKKVWVSEAKGGDKQILTLLEEGYQVFRTSTDQIPEVIIEQDDSKTLCWKDCKSE